MSRQVPSYPLLHFPLFLCSVIIFINAGCVDSLSDHCSELVQFDIDKIEDHLSKLNLTDVPTVKMMVAGFKCPISALPFGTLKSDWSRLLLLQEAQPDKSIIKRKLVRLMRILIVAYYQMEERFDVTDSNKYLRQETKSTVSDAEKLCCSNNSDWMNESSSNNVALHDSHPQSFLTIVPVETDHSRIESHITGIEIATIENSSSSSDTNSDVPFKIKLGYQDVTSSTDLTPYSSSDAVKAKNATFKVLDNCLKQSLNDIARRQSNRTQIFEILRNKAKYTERAVRTGIEIDDYEKYRTKISPPTNEFWKYVTFPTDSPLTISGIGKRVYRLNEFKKSLRKSRKRAKSDGNVNENLRQFYGVEKNEAGVKKYTSDRNNIAIERDGKKVTG
ncbi:uncharacterized protein [Anoplolepis gracilipes]|uniref:uncharacterized protein n=1 Tax=Anoplolepis gracilipes TaxID=354296 RepID=UPI003B9E0912